MIDIKDDELKKLADFIKKKYGVNLFEKRLLIQGRLQKVLAQRNLKSFSEYYDFVAKDVTGRAETELLNKVTTNYTFFMREPEHFAFFKNIVLPYLVGEYGDEKSLRIWSAGCASGEEAYTLDMVISDYFGLNKGEWDTKILATDISSEAINLAMGGIYSSSDIENVPTAWKNRYFETYDKTRSQVKQNIRSDVIFRKFNLMNTQFPFKRKFHVIFCRNVMIYFDSKTKEKLIKKFYDWTVDGGYLFIGHSESVGFGGIGYKTVMPSVYRK
ncbi:MAG: protein-glutamate O-methyltransferase CheR [Sedimentibacter sp.]|uniref:CheR family methyltransferase n=1 Tax=Sedimentibacter sp. TaxID=1960295 RepID=UPI0031582FFA